MRARTTGSRPQLSMHRGGWSWLVVAGALFLLARGPGFAAQGAQVPGRVTASGAAAFDSALRAWVQGNAAMTARAYDRAFAGAESLESAVTRFLEEPSETTLRAAREAWRASREGYEPTEVFRFSDGPIDGDSALAGREGPENRINAWPVDEAYLDSVAGSPRGGIIPQLSIPMDRGTLERAHGSRDESEVTLGFHAIEFLLWGQDRDTVTAGRRPYTDFVAGDPVRDRRRTCLALLVQILVEDLGAVRREWEPGAGHYPDRFEQLPPREALRRALTGAATLSGFELASERIGVPLATHAQEFEQSCFSDNTVRDLSSNIEGLALVLEGDGESQGLLPVFRALDPHLASELRERLDAVRGRLLDVPAPFDAVILSSAGDPRRHRYEALAGELIGLSGVLRRAGARAGVTVSIGGGG